MSVAGWLREYGPDSLAIAISLAMVATYYVTMLYHVRRDPLYTIHGVNQVARTLWVEEIMSHPGKDVMAIQTLRNFVMGSSLMASTAALLVVGTLTLSGQAEGISRSWHVFAGFGSGSPEMWMVKVLCLLADFIVAFFAFAMAVRLANHVGFMINIPAKDVPAALSPQNVARRLNRAGNHFAIGLRAFFFAVPLVFWLFGPGFLVIATFGLVVTLHRLDRNPSA
ncbi:MAG: DUF599 domain-containing protein [Usitatibacter sp.]